MPTHKTSRRQQKLQKLLLTLRLTFPWLCLKRAHASPCEWPRHATVAAAAVLQNPGVAQQRAGTGPDSRVPGERLLQEVAGLVADVGEVQHAAADGLRAASTTQQHVLRRKRGPAFLLVPAAAETQHPAWPRQQLIG
jgi:hypothetical protein